MNSIRPVVEALREAKTTLLLTHVRPDFDTIASALALRLGLMKRGKEVTVYCADGAPPNMRFLPGAKEVVDKLHPTKKFDVTVGVDASSPERFGTLFEKGFDARFGKILKIDHHIVKKEFAEHAYVDTERASSAELVWDVIEHLPAELDKKIALCIHSGIVSDTGGFRYSNTNAQAFQTASRMLETGINSWDVTVKLYETKPKAEITLLGDVLQTLETFERGKAALLQVTDAMMKKHKAEVYMLDGFVNFARSIKGVEVGMLIHEQGNGKCKISLRSKGLINVADIASKLGGGGHKNAAGCSMEGDIEAVRKKLIESAKRSLAKAMKAKKKKK